jgi:polyketide biosynthesis enoyl-CoA hydratase PksI
MNALVKLDWSNPTTAIISMHDSTKENTLSSELISGLQEAFAMANANQKAKVIVLTGLENQFCCGNAHANLDMSSVRELLLNCELPIIAAVQGNALGDGLVLAAYADVLILAEESIYSATYLKGGITPGSGATYIIPKKFGPLLGNEILYTSQNYLGQTLKTRNVPLRIISKDKVISTAMDLTKDFCDKPEPSLRLLKQRFNQIMKTEMEPHLTVELMHDESTHK